MCKSEQNAHQITSLQNRCYFFRVFQACKTRSGLPFPRRGCLKRVSGSRSQHEMLPFAGLKKRVKMTPVLQAIRLQITDSNPFVLWLKKKRKQIALLRQKGSCLPFRMTFNRRDAQQKYMFVFDGKVRRSFRRESVTLWMRFVIRDSKSK